MKKHGVTDAAGIIWHWNECDWCGYQDEMLPEWEDDRALSTCPDCGQKVSA